MLSIENLSVSYGKLQVLKNLNLLLAPARVHGLVGLNGAGKTTLLNTIAGWLKPRAGFVTFDGKPLPVQDRSYLESELLFYPLITGYEYLGLFTGTRNRTVPDNWNKLFHLPLDQLVDGYSHGMKKKIALLAVLQQNRPVIILDEPFNGLDLDASRLISLIIMKLKERKRLVLVTSHIMASLTGICDEIHLLRDGVIAFSRSSDQFQSLESEIFQHTDAANRSIIETLI
jgi:ABC-2 type transport system ATP-binding protein